MSCMAAFRIVCQDSSHHLHRSPIHGEGQASCQQSGATEILQAIPHSSGRATQIYHTIVPTVESANPKKIGKKRTHRHTIHRPGVAAT